jgi:predicted ester cyclase
VVEGSTGGAALRAEILGTHKGEWFGIPPTNKRVSIALHEFHHLKDGRTTLQPTTAERLASHNLSQEKIT